jgi:hypothetical protein
VKTKIDIRFGSLFPWPFQLVAVLVLLVALSLIAEKTFISFGLILISGFVLSGYEGTEIDKGEKSYRDYKSFFFFKSGSKVKFTAIEKIFVSTSKTRQRLHTAHTNKHSIYDNIEYNGLLKFSDGTKIQLLQKRNKAELIKALENIAKILDAPLEDNTAVAS